MFIFFQSLCFILLFNSCIFFKLNSLKDTKSNGIIFKAPTSPYVKIKKTTMDAQWENTKNKNILSFFSNCSSSYNFTTLNQLQTELLTDLKDFYIIKKKISLHQKKQAHYLYLNKWLTNTHVISMHLFLFKKETCFYVLNFLNPLVKKNTHKNIPEFNKFIKEFKAP